MQKLKSDGQAYTKLLQQYLESNHEAFLDEAKQMSVSFVNRNIYPEEIVRIHMQALETLYVDAFGDHKRSLEFLLESLIAYRQAQEEYEKMKLEQLELRSEIQVAAKRQKKM